MSVWVEITLLFHNWQTDFVTLHVSVWVEIAFVAFDHSVVAGHAPRERVSWNFTFRNCEITTASRSTWACELKCMVCNANPRVTSHAPRERVSWNLSRFVNTAEVYRHAPRERVSWNLTNLIVLSMIQVTLHVSVWVEMKLFTVFTSAEMVTLHVSVWVEICTVSKICATH